MPHLPATGPSMYAPTSQPVRGIQPPAVAKPAAPLPAAAASATARHQHTLRTPRISLMGPGPDPAQIFENMFGRPLQVDPKTGISNVQRRQETP